MTTAYLSHPACALHDMGTGHPECPARIAAIEDALRDAGLLDKLQHEEAPQATDQQLSLAHSAEHVERVVSMAPADGRVQIDPDTAMNPQSLEAARRAAGAVIRAVDLVMAGEVDSAFCNVRPPGHHAEYEQSMGFCLFDNVAVAAMHAIREHRLERVAVVDFDVHHGNGSEDILQNQDGVLFCSSFQHPFYPGNYLPSVPGRRVNVPLPAGTGSDGFRSAIEEHWLPALHDFRPQLLLISAGFDAHCEDPLASLELTDDDYQWVTERLCEVAAIHSNGRIVSALEGGYALAALGRSAARHVAVLHAAGSNSK